MSFDKSKPLHIVADNGEKSEHIMLTKDNDWSMDTAGIWFYWNTMYKFIPYASVIEMMQIKLENSTGKSVIIEADNDLPMEW